jgi:hypothetical protein
MGQVPVGWVDVRSADDGSLLASWAVRSDQASGQVLGLVVGALAGAFDGEALSGVAFVPTDAGTTLTTAAIAAASEAVIA